MDAPPGIRVFERRSVVRTTLAQLEAFHRDPEALRKLTPPPIFMQVHADSRRSLAEGEIDFTLWFGPLPVRWRARHEPTTQSGFADVQVAGPLRCWRHEHIFEPARDGVTLIDRVTFEHKPGPAGWLTRLLFDGLSLRFLFLYRHWRTRRALES